MNLQYEICKRCERKNVCCFMEWSKDQWCETKGATRQWCCLRNKHCKMKVLKDNGNSNALQENVTLHKTNTLQDAKWRRQY